MRIERFEVPGLAQNSYVVSEGGEAVAIDPVRDVARYLDYLNREGLRLVAVVETHIHADFAAGSVALAEATGAELALSAYDEGERYVYAMKHRALRDGDTVSFGAAQLEALWTPGHTPEHLSFLLRGADGALAAMFSGDFLFAGALGRPDLLGEAVKVALARELHTSVVERIAALPDALVVYPGHGAGSLCGAGLSDRAETTLGLERRTNVFFSRSEAEFVREILVSVPPMPAYYPRMKSLNAAGAPVLRELPGGRALTVPELAARKDDVVVLDVREVEAFAAGHVPGAVHIVMGPSLAMWAGWLLDAGTPIVLVGAGGGEVEARLALVRVGLDDVAGYLQDGMEAWAEAGLPVATTGLVRAEEVAASDDLLVLDVRHTSELIEGSIAGAMHLPLGDLAAGLPAVPRDRAVVTVCESGLRASAAASLLQCAGFARVSEMVGGMREWRQPGLPIV